MDKYSRYDNVREVISDLNRLPVLKQTLPHLPQYVPTTSPQSRTAVRAVIQLDGCDSPEDIIELLRATGESYENGGVPVELILQNCRLGVTQGAPTSMTSSLQHQDDIEIDKIMKRRRAIWETGWDQCQDIGMSGSAYFQSAVDDYVRFIEQYDLRIQVFLKKDLNRMLSLILTFRSWKNDEYEAALRHAEHALSLKPTDVFAQSLVNTLRTCVDMRPKTRLIQGYDDPY